MAAISLKKVDLNIPIIDRSALRLISRRGRNLNKISHLDFEGNLGETCSGPLTISVLKKIDLELQDGDRLGIFGLNGAGKTTLLKVIAGIISQSGGAINIIGKTHYFSGGLYIHPDSTGRENVILAYRLSAINDRSLSEIMQEVEILTELGDYLDMPVKSYSAGMAARLSFAISTMSRPDILLIDEGIGAGDKKFQSKVDSRINSFTTSAKIVVTTSHSRAWLEKICNRGCVLHKGEVRFIGSLEEAARYYESI